MRLTRPTFAVPLVVTCDPHRDLPKSSLNEQMARDANALHGMEQLCIAQTLVLPQSFGYAQYSKFSNPFAFVCFYSWPYTYID